jgi:hypothetical protein
MTAKNEYERIGKFIYSAYRRSSCPRASSPMGGGRLDCRVKVCTRRHADRAQDLPPRPPAVRRSHHGLDVKVSVHAGCGATV